MSLTINAIRSDLKALASQGPPILSLYLVTHPTTALGRNLDPQFKSLVQPLLESVTTPSESEQLNRELQVAWSAVTRLQTPPQSLAVFSSAGRNLFKLFELSLPLSPQARWDHSGYLRPLIDALDEHEQTLVVFLDKQHARIFRILLGAIAVLGIAEVSKAILEQRAHALIFTHGVQYAGAHCHHCNFLSPEPAPQECPYCGLPLARHEDLLERLIERMQDQGGGIEAFRGSAGESLNEHGGIAATLRYSLSSEEHHSETLRIHQPQR